MHKQLQLHVQIFTTATETKQQKTPLTEKIVTIVIALHCLINFDIDYGSIELFQQENDHLRGKNKEYYQCLYYTQV